MRSLETRAGRALEVAHCVTRPSVEMETSASPRSGPRATQRTRHAGSSWPPPPLPAAITGAACALHTGLLQRTACGARINPSKHSLVHLAFVGPWYPFLQFNTWAAPCANVSNKVVLLKHCFYAQMQHSHTLELTNLRCMAIGKQRRSKVKQTVCEQVTACTCL